MKHSLEPPSKLTRVKEVNIKKGNNQLILLLKNGKFESKPVNSGNGKNLENSITLKSQDYVFDSDYLKTNNEFSGAVSATAKSLSFTSNLDANPNQMIQENNYWKNISDAEIAYKKKPTDFYEIKSPYSFASSANEEVKKENLSFQYKEQDNQEILYTLYLAEEDPIPGNLKKF